MKKTFTTLFFLFLFYVGFTQTMDSTILKLPTSKVILQNGKAVPFKSIYKNNKASVLVFFSPTCDHCQHEAKGIANNMKKLSKLQFYFIANHQPTEIDSFAKAYKLANMKNVRFMHDIGNSVFRHFAIKAYPSILVINAKNKITANYQGMLVNPNDIVAAAAKE